WGVDERWALITREYRPAPRAAFVEDRRQAPLGQVAQSRGVRQLHLVFAQEERVHAGRESTEGLEAVGAEQNEGVEGEEGPVERLHERPLDLDRHRAQVEGPRLSPLRRDCVGQRGDLRVGRTLQAMDEVPA